MENSNFEKQYKKILQDFEAPLETQEFWEGLEPHLPRKEKRKRRLLLWFFFGLGLLSLIGIYLQSSSTLKSKKDVEVTTAPAPSSTNSQQQNLNNPTKSKTAVNSSNSEPSPTRDHSPTRATYTPTTPPSLKTGSISKMTASQKTPKIQFSPSGEKDNLLVKAKKSTPSIAPRKKVTKKENITTPKKHTHTTRSNKKKKIKKKTKRKVRIRKRKPKWQPVFYGWIGTSLALHSYKATGSEPYFQELVATKKDHTKNLETISAGMSYNLIHRDGLVFSMGIQYRLHSELMEISQNIEETVQLKNQVTKQVVNGAGNIIKTYKGNITGTKIRVIHHKQYSRYHIISIPFGAGYHYANRHGHFHQFTGGLEWTPVFIPKGKILKDNDYNLTSLKSISKPSTGLGIWATYKYGRKWNKKISWYIAPTLQYNLTPFTKKKADSIEKLNFLGIRLGIGSQKNQ